MSNLYMDNPYHFFPVGAGSNITIYHIWPIEMNDSSGSTYLCRWSGSPYFRYGYFIDETGESHMEHHEGISNNEAEYLGYHLCA